MTAPRALFGIAGILLGAGAAAGVGARRSRRALSAETARLVRATATFRPGTATLEGLDVPAPVRRYLALALPRNQRISMVRLRQRGKLRTDPQSSRWLPFDAEHVAVPSAPGFVWDATISFAPLLHLRVRDAFIDGQGSGRVMLSPFTVSAVTGTPEMNAGSLHRYLAEAVWYPSALLPADNLHWTGIDANTARATLTTHGTSVSLEFRFAETGEITGIYTPTRWGRFDGGYREVPWEGHFRNYQVKDGILIPTEGEVGWYVDGTWKMVWSGHIVEYDARTRALA